MYHPTFFIFDLHLYILASHAWLGVPSRGRTGTTLHPPYNLNSLLHLRVLSC